MDFIKCNVDVIKLNINLLNFRHYLFCLSPWPLRKHGMEDMVDTADTGAMEDTGGMVDMDMDARNDLLSPIMVMGAMVVTEVMVAMAVAMEAMVDMDTDVKSRTK